MDNIEVFCNNTQDASLLDNLSYEIKQFFILVSKYVVEKGKGFIDIAEIVLNRLDIKGNVTIARLGGRGKTWPDAPVGFKNINVTSGSANKAGPYSMKQVSPMYLGPVDKDVWPIIGDKEAKVFENYWQYSKIFPDMKPVHIDSDGNVTEAWKKWREKGFGGIKGERHPAGTKTNEVMYVDDKGRRWFRYKRAIGSKFGDEYMGYIESRKKVYVPLYYNLLIRTNAFKFLKEEVKQGKNVQILDLDAPPTTELINVEMLRKSINEESPYGKPFGHGYIIAAALLDIKPEDYI